VQLLQLASNMLRHAMPANDSLPAGLADTMVCRTDNVYNCVFSDVIVEVMQFTRNQACGALSDELLHLLGLQLSCVVPAAMSQPCSRHAMGYVES
jgi:hypothetical protein